MENANGIKSNKSLLMKIPIMMSFLGFLKAEVLTNFSLSSRTNVVFYVCVFFAQILICDAHLCGGGGVGGGGGDASDQIQASIIL
jgi:hypothetical protein